MRKHGGTPSWRDKHVTLAAISPPGVARGRFVGGQQSGLAGSKPPPLFTRGASSCSSQGRRQGEPWGASPRPSAPTYLPLCGHGGQNRLDHPPTPHPPPPGPPHTSQPLGATPGRSPHEAIFLQDTIADMDPVDLIIASLDVKGAFPNTTWLLLEAVWKGLGLLFYYFASGYIRTRKYTVRTGAGLTPFMKPDSGVPQGGAEGSFLYLLVTLPLSLAIEQDYPAYAPYPLLSPLVGFADDTNLTVSHTPHKPHAPVPGPTVTQQANDLLDVTVSYLSDNNLIVHPTKSVAMIKGSATPPTLGPQGPLMQVVTTTTHLGVIQAANPEDATLPPKLQSDLAHLPRYASPTTKALSLSHQSLAYYLTGVLNASIGFQALHLTHPTTALQPATRAVTKAWAAHGGWPTSIPTRAI